MYRTIETSLWTDPVVRTLSPEGKLLFLYLITSPQGHVAGIYHLPPVLISHETGLTVQQIDTLSDTLSSVGLARFDKKTDVVWVKNMARYQARGDKSHRAAGAHLATLHNSCLIQEFLRMYPQVKKYFKAYPIGYPTDRGGRPRIKEQEQEQTLTATSPSPLSADKARRDSLKPEHPEKLNGATIWAAWVDLHRERKLPDPAALGPDLAAGKQIVKAIPKDKLKAVLQRYLSDPDVFLVKQGHPLRMLASRLNVYLQAPVASVSRLGHQQNLEQDFGGDV